MKKRYQRLTKRQFMERQYLLPMFFDNVIFPKDWSIEEILELHEFLLEESLQTLTKKGKSMDIQKAKLDVLDWVFAPNIEMQRIKGEMVEVDNTRQPFSFHVCCILMGADPDEIRDHILTKVESKYQKAIVAYKQAA